VAVLLPTACRMGWCIFHGKSRRPIEKSAPGAWEGGKWAANLRRLGGGAREQPTTRWGAGGSLGAIPDYEVESLLPAAPSRRRGQKRLDLFLFELPENDLFVPRPGPDCIPSCRVESEEVRVPQYVFR
jgi:hypothetical protein